MAPALAVVTGVCGVTAPAPTAQDNCGGMVVGTTTDPLTYNSQGTFTIHWTFSDGNGNASTADQTVVVSDTTGPVPPVLAPATGVCKQTSFHPRIGPAQASMAVGGVTVTLRSALLLLPFPSLKTQCTTNVPCVV
jgi:hypothetical protein